MMDFEFYSNGGEKTAAAKIISYELAADMDAACDGLRVYFYSQKPVGEIHAVNAFEKGKKVFCGFADKVQVSLDGGGYTVFVYARSSAALLADNEALPGQYEHPSSRQLWLLHAKPFGFGFGLPEAFSDNSYLVEKGVSCFGAVNRFMQYTCGKNIYVDPENTLRVFSAGSRLKTLSGEHIMSAVRTYDKSSAVSRIDYKINSGDKYIYHLESLRAKKLGISAAKLINLSSLPVWQREAEVHRRIKNSLAALDGMSITLAGSPDFSLADRVDVSIERLAASGEYFVYGLVRSGNAQGSKTTLALRKEIDGELINYVAEQEL